MFSLSRIPQDSGGQVSAHSADQAPAVENSVLLLTTSLLVDRVFLYTDLIDRLSRSARVSIWAASERGLWPMPTNGDSPRIEPFPNVLPFREFPHNILRRLNEFVWDYRFKNPSRTSVRRYVKDKQQAIHVRALKGPAKIISTVGAERFLEDGIEKMLLGFQRSPEATMRLSRQRPSVLVTTGPFQYEQPAVYSAARQLSIPTLAYIPSWDNISTKNRMVFKYDGYIVWNDKMKAELVETYPQTRNSPIYPVGAPQFDIFHKPEFHQTREEFCGREGLDPARPVIVYAIGSPNFLKEHHGATFLAKRVAEGRLGDVQLLVRPHPIHDNAEMKALFQQYRPRVQLQSSQNAGLAVAERSQDRAEIIEWVNTFRHADVVVNLSSTVTIDAALFDKPVVNLDFDPQPGARDQALIKDVNHLWTHFKPVAESGGVWLVNDFEEMESAIQTYLKDPSLHREQRRWIVDHVCGYSDGKCGSRMADAIIDFIERRMNGRSC